MKATRQFPLIRLRPRSDSDYVSHNRTVLATGLDGWVHDDPDQGLYVHQTRMLCAYKYRLNDVDWIPVALSKLEQHTWMGYYIQAAPWLDQNANPDRGSGQVEAVSQQTIELRLSRSVANSVREDVQLTNFTQAEARFELRLQVDGDFLDQAEDEDNRELRGELRREWRRSGDGPWEYDLDYKASNHYSHQGNEGRAEIHRGLAVRIDQSDSSPEFRDGQIVFQIALGPHGTWGARLEWTPRVEDIQEDGIPAGFDAAMQEMSRRKEVYIAEATSFSSAESDTLGPFVCDALEQAKQDLAALRLYDIDRNEREWTMAAGLPLYIALYGRDVLTVGWQSAMMSLGMMPGTLSTIARSQGARKNDWRDEEPGKMLHEAHTGPLSALRFNPRARYYGSATTAKFYPVVVSQLWHWTGDKELVSAFVEPAMRAMQWMDHYSDFDRDGFYEYVTRSEQGVRHQGWKDSRDAMVWGDGSQVDPPITTCEEQSYGYAAKLYMSEVLWFLDRKEEAWRLFRQAQEMKKHFNDAFWWPEESFFYMGLGQENKPINSVGSNVGHLLAAGIIDDSLVRPAADRLMQDDLYTGWGFRTLSSKNPAFNPYSYHRGSVWPVEHGTIALGMLRYGYHEYVQRICLGMFEAAAMFDYGRLPEVFSGHQRDEQHPFPALYPKTNWPQAWSSSAMFLMVQSMLGLYPYAPLNILIVDPHLPEWLPELTVSNLDVGKAVVSIRFYREKDGKSNYEVLEKRGKLRVIRQASPWSQTDGFAERVVDLLSSLAAA